MLCPPPRSLRKNFRRLRKASQRHLRSAKRWWGRERWWQQSCWRCCHLHRNRRRGKEGRLLGLQPGQKPPGTAACTLPAGSKFPADAWNKNDSLLKALSVEAANSFGKQHDDKPAAPAAARTPPDYETPAA